MSASPLWRRYDRLLGPDAAADVKEELRFHLEAHVDDLIAQGLTPEAARRQAEQQFGDMRALQKISVEIKEKMQRHKRIEDYLRDCLQDARYAVRTLVRDPGFAAVSIVILALAIGANIAVFSVVNTLLLRPLPFPDSRELVWIAPPGDLALSDSTYSSDAYEEFRDQSRAYRAVTGYFAFSGPDNDKLTSLSVPEPVTSISVIGNFFQVLGVKPALGSLFTMDDSRTGASPVILLANAWWRRQFNADPGIVGKTIDVDGKPARVMGVLPESFDFGAVFSPGSKVDFFTPLDLDQARNWGNIVTLMGRLKPGVTPEQASDDSRRVVPNLYQNVKIPATKGGYTNGIGAIPLRDHVTGKLHRSLTALWCAVGLILLIAGVNLSNLLLARGAARSKEFAVRGALGASRGRTAMQLLIESLVLCGAGSLLGLGLAALLIAWIAHQESVALPLLSTLRIDGATLGWTVLLAGFTTVLFGLVPRVRETDGNLQEGLKDSGPGAGLGRGDERVRSMLVVSEVALACVLLVSAGLFLRSFLRVLNVDLGFEAEHAASISVDYDDSAPTNDASAAKRAFLFQRILTRIGALPGVKTAGIADYLPFGTNRQWGAPTPQGKTFAPGQLPDPLVYVVTPGFIHAMGIGLRGRDFAWTDTMHSQQVVLINASAARLYWPGEDAVGKVLTNGTPPLLHVIGVVDDVHEENVEGLSGAQIYYPVTQQNPNGAQLVIRTSLAPSALAGSIMRVLRELNPGQPAVEFRPIRTIVERARSPRRFFTLLVGAFAGLGLLLAALGIYGVISYSVAQKTQEIGVRMAIGASAGQIAREILLKTLRLVLVGIALGTLTSLALARLIASMLFATSPWDATTYGAMVLLLIAVALVSGYLPARRASGIEPMSALRIQ
jgi:predicted permease